ncbi:MAG: orotate phosphoribosyltransferase [Syntrophomonadaceae bacterium]|nr:orotate phosphoribosyltransferase [Syntrophomonadaceae bacterium]
MLSEQDVIQIFTDAGALLEGHFTLTSGRHSDKYMQCAQVLKYPAYTEKLAKLIADDFRGDKVELVVGPAMGGIVVAYEVARQLEVASIFTERQDGEMTLRRGFKIEKGTRVLVVEDVVTTGGSVREVIDLINSLGGIVVGVGLLVDRSNGQETFGVKQKATLTMEVLSWEPEECPICKEGKIPAIKPGSRT